MSAEPSPGRVGDTSDQSFDAQAASSVSPANDVTVRPRPLRTSTTPRRRSTCVLVSTPEDFDDSVEEVATFGGRDKQTSRKGGQHAFDATFGSWSSALDAGTDTPSNILRAGQSAVDMGNPGDGRASPQITNGRVRSAQRSETPQSGYTPSEVSAIGEEVDPPEIIEDDVNVTERTPLLSGGDSPIAPAATPHSKNMHTVLNSVNLLSGVGMLSLPYAMSLCGWVVGISLLLFFPILASTTAKLLIQCMEVRTTTLPGPAGGAASYTPKKSMSYGDAAETAFGPRARRFIDVVYQLELMAACVAFVILASDSVHALYPDIPLLAVKVAVAAVVLLTTFIKSVKVLSYGSAIGILCTINLLIIILFDGTSTYETPGSLWNPAQTEMWPRSWNRVALAIGMMFVGFDGHAVFPAIYRDMRTPESFAKCINLTYVVVTVLYLTVAVAGYLMFGNSILPEITQNLPLIPGYNPASTNWTIYLIALNPIAKYALCLRPVHTSLEIRLASKKHASTIDEEEVIPPSPPPPYSESVTPAVSSPPTPPFLPRTQPPYRPPQPPVSPHTSTTASYFHAILIRSSLTLIILAIAILFPHFHDVMATLGSLFSGFVAVMFPCAAFGKLYWRDRELHRGIRVTVVAGLTVGVIIIVGGLSGVVWGPG